MGFPGGSAGKESACKARDLGSVPGLGRSPAEGKGYPLQYSGLENSMDCVVHGVAKSQTWLSNFHFTSMKLIQIRCQKSSIDNLRWARNVEWRVSQAWGRGEDLLKEREPLCEMICLWKTVLVVTWGQIIKVKTESQVLISPEQRLSSQWEINTADIGEGNGNPLQCSCLENPRNSGAWWAAIYRVTQSQTRLKWLSSSSM